MMKRNKFKLIFTKLKPFYSNETDCSRLWSFIRGFSVQLLAEGDVVERCVLPDLRPPSRVFGCHQLTGVRWGVNVNDPSRIEGLRIEVDPLKGGSSRSRALNTTLGIYVHKFRGKKLDWGLRSWSMLLARWCGRWSPRISLYILSTILFFPSQSSKHKA